MGRGVTLNGEGARGDRGLKSRASPPPGCEVGAEPKERVSVGSPRQAGEHRPHPRHIRVADRWLNPLGSMEGSWTGGAAVATFAGYRSEPSRWGASCLKIFG